MCCMALTLLTLSFQLILIGSAAWILAIIVREELAVRRVRASVAAVAPIRGLEVVTPLRRVPRSIGAKAAPKRQPAYSVGNGSRARTAKPTMSRSRLARV